MTLTVSDALGREVVLQKLEARAGTNTLQWDGRSDAGTWLANGVYIVRLQTAAGSVSKKVVLQRMP